MRVSRRRKVAIAVSIVLVFAFFFAAPIQSVQGLSAPVGSEYYYHQSLSCYVLGLGVMYFDGALYAECGFDYA
jgi:hypothetical protein